MKTFNRRAPSRGVAAALDVAGRRPVDTLAALVATAGTVTILVNALVFQEGRHPAPLFGPSVSTASPAEALKRSELVAQIQKELVTQGVYDGAVDGLLGARTSAAIMAFERAARLEPTGEATERVLGALLIAPAPKPDVARRAASPSAVPAPKPAPEPARVPAPPAPRASVAPPVMTTGSTSPAPSPKLMAVQRALAKLGYGPITIDGKMGAATRAALLGFERDRKLPQTGEPKPQTLRELQAITGAPLE